MAVLFPSMCRGAAGEKGSRRFVFLLCFLPVLITACRKEVPEEFYIRAWVVASLKASEKDTQVKIELMEIYREEGFSEADWIDAETRLYRDEVRRKINKEIQVHLAASEGITRTRYVRIRATAAVRAEVWKSSLGREVEERGRRRGFSPIAWAAVHALWQGDGLTESEIEDRIAVIRKALNRVTRTGCKELLARAIEEANRKGTPLEEEKTRLCEARGLDPVLFELAYEIWEPGASNPE